MGNTIPMVLAGNSFGAGNYTFVSNPEPANSAPIANTDKKNIARQPQFFQGRIKEAKTGIILKATDGSNYLLIGLSLNDIVRKNVAITSIVKNGKEINIIYVVGSDVTNIKQKSLMSSNQNTFLSDYL